MSNRAAQKQDDRKNAFWNFIDNIEGDKVVWIIVFMLTMLSMLAIFSSTSRMAESGLDRIDIIRKHSIFVILGYVVIFLLYKVRKIGWFRFFSQFGFLVSLILLAFLDLHLDLGFARAAKLNDVAYRVIVIFGFQLHVFEVVKVAMVMYLAWALSAYRQDQEDIARNRKSTTFTIANRLAKTKRFSFMGKPFWKRAFYMYIPILTVCILVLLGSNSSALFIGGVLLATMLIGGVGVKEISIALLCGILGLGILIGIHHASDRKFIPQIERIESRITTDWDGDILLTLKKKSPEWYKERNQRIQPCGAEIAIHEGGLFGKGSGNSTQKYIVPHIYSDYMYSFLIEEYGLAGGIFVLILYVSLLARGSMIARLCKNEFAKIAVGGLTVLITGQAFMHMFVSVGIGPMTGQTLPLISDGRCAFIVFCVAFGIILSISRMARNRIKEEEEAAVPLYESERDDIQAALDTIEQIDSDL